MKKERLLFIFNPKSGMGFLKNHLMEIVDIMVKAGYEVTIHATQSKLDAKHKATEAAGYDRIVCAGGDGTLDEVVAGFLASKTDLPIGYIPAGSTNDFASSLGIPSNMTRAAKIAVGNEIGSFDVGTFNEETFVYIAAFGLFTEVSYQTPQGLKNVLGHLAYVLSAAKSLSAIPRYLMHIEAEDRSFDDRFIYGMVTNSSSVGGFKGMTGKGVDLSDGEFEVTLIRTPNDAIELHEIIAYLLGETQSSKMVYAFKTKHICMSSNEQIPWTLDGEYGGKCAMAEITNLCQKVKIAVDKQK